MNALPLTPEASSRAKRSVLPVVLYLTAMWIVFYLDTDLGILLSFASLLVVPILWRWRRWRAGMMAFLLTPFVAGMLWTLGGALLGYMVGTATLWRSCNCNQRDIDLETRLVQRHTAHPWGMSEEIQHELHNRTLHRLVGWLGPMRGCYAGPEPTTDDLLACWKNATPWQDWADRSGLSYRTLGTIRTRISPSVIFTQPDDDILPDRPVSVAEWQPGIPAVFIDFNEYDLLECYIIILEQNAVFQRVELPWPGHAEQGE